MNSTDQNLLESEFEMNLLKILLNREKLTREICSELNNFVDLKNTLISIIIKLRKLTGCEAIAIRLKDEWDYPYYVYEGFPESFILHEDSLCPTGLNGKPLDQCSSNEILLECMCGNVIQGRTDPKQPFFTSHGSFWTNHTGKLIQETSDEDKGGTTRNFCNSSGYLSVALIPIKARGETLGLVQINDYQKNKFDSETIEFLEMICENLGLAIQNALIFSKLKEKYSRIKHLEHPITICPSCKTVKKDPKKWEGIIDFLQESLNIESIDEFCPDCLQRL